MMVLLAVASTTAGVMLVHPQSPTPADRQDDPRPHGCDNRRVAINALRNRAPHCRQRCLVTAFCSRRLCARCLVSLVASRRETPRRAARGSPDHRASRRAKPVSDLLRRKWALKLRFHRWERHAMEAAMDPVGTLYVLAVFFLVSARPGMRPIEDSSRLRNAPPPHFFVDRTVSAMPYRNKGGNHGHK
jgi:hypothetical protein